MRRTERERHDAAYFHGVFRRSEVITLSFNGSDFPYAVPLSFVEVEGTLYMHSALSGMKLECLQCDPRVHFSLYEYLGVDRKAATVRYRSVSGTGIAELVTDVETKQKALTALADKYQSECALPVPDRLLDMTAVIRVKILTLCGKCNEPGTPCPSVS